MENLFTATTTKYEKGGAVAFNFSMMELVREKVLKDIDVLLYHILVNAANEKKQFTYTAKQAKEELGWGASKLRNSLARLKAVGLVKEIGKMKRTTLWLLSDLEEPSYYKEAKKEAEKATETILDVPTAVEKKVESVEVAFETPEEPKTAVQEAKQDELTFDELFEQLQQQQNNPFTPSQNTPKETNKPHKNELPTDLENIPDDFFELKPHKYDHNENILSNHGFKPYEKLTFNSFKTPLKDDGLPDLDELCKDEPFITEEEWNELLK